MGPRHILRVAPWAIFALLFATAPWALAETSQGPGGERCPVCGTPPGPVRFVVEGADGARTVFACPRCAFQSLDMGTVRRATATDFLSRDTVDAKKAFYLRNTSYGACCPPFWLSFAHREDAEKFARGFGGKVLEYEEAVALFRK